MELVMGWPEWIIVSSWALGLIVWGAHHGEKPTYTYNIGSKIVGVGLSFAVLYWGGFFS